MPALQADRDHEVFLLGLFVRREYASDAGSVDRHGLLHKDVLARFNRGVEVNRPEARRRGQNHEIGPAVDRLLIGIEAGKLAILRNVDGRVFEQFVTIAFAAFDLLGDVIQAGLHVISKCISGGP